VILNARHSIRNMRYRFKPILRAFWRRPERAPPTSGRQWVEESLKGEPANARGALVWSGCRGELAFVEVKGELGIKALHRELEQLGGAYALRERSDAYGGEFTRENDVLRLENTIFWDEKC
jgi:hypothetical protein